MVAEQVRPRRLTRAGRNGEMTVTSMAVENIWVTETSNVTYTERPLVYDNGCTTEISNVAVVYSYIRGGECQRHNSAPAEIKSTEPTGSEVSRTLPESTIHQFSVSQCPIASSVTARHITLSFT